MLNETLNKISRLMYILNELFPTLYRSENFALGVISLHDLPNTTTDIEVSLNYISSTDPSRASLCETESYKLTIDTSDDNSSEDSTKHTYLFVIIAVSVVAVLIILFLIVGEEDFCFAHQKVQNCLRVVLDERR